MKERIDFSSLDEAFGLSPSEPVLVDWDEVSTLLEEAEPWNKGIPHTDETCQQIRETLTGVKHTPERRHAMSLARMGKEPWNKGRKGRQKNHVDPPNQKGKKWYHNPLTGESKMCYTEPDTNWLRGRGKLKLPNNNK